MKALKLIPVILLVFGLASSGRTAALDITAFFNESPNGFVNEGVITNGLYAPIALGFLPDNRMLVLEKGGEVLIADPESGQFSSYLDIVSRVESGQERGLLEIAVPPDFDALTAGKNFIYLYYTRAAGTNRAVIARFTHQENAGGLTSTANPASEIILWTDTDSLNSCCHFGGGLDFGPDGKIWLTSADKFNTTNVGEGPPGGADVSADLSSTGGKVIRINIDGSIPNGNDGWPANPYYDAGDTDDDGDNFDPYPNGQIGLDQAHQSIWAYGLRNPFRADWDIVNELFYIGEVGGNQGFSRDDIHLGSLDQPGVFYGWNFYEGVNNVQVSTANTRVFNPADFPPPDNDLGDPFAGDYFSAPIYDIPHSSLTGGFVYRGTMFPDVFDGVYFFGNYENNYIKFLDLDFSGTVVQNVYDFKPSSKIPGAVTSIVFLEEGIDGALYYVNYSATGGQVQRIIYLGNDAPSIDSASVTDNKGNPNDGAGDPPLTVTFNATVSDTDNAMNELSYTLSFGDGTPDVTGTPNGAGGISVQHVYGAEGFYNASLLVSDGNKSTLSPPFSITVGDPNDPPEILSAVADKFFGDPGLLVTFTANVTDPDANDPPGSLTYSWNFGDGTPNANGSPNGAGEITVQHTYTSAGNFKASVQVSDGEAPAVHSADISIQIGVSSELPVLNGLVFQTESFIKVGTNGTAVTEWLDESGFGNNLAAFGEPQYVQNATPSGLPAIVLDGNGDYLTRTGVLTGFPAAASARTLFFVVDYDTVTNNEYAGFAYGSPVPNQAFGLTLEGNQNDLTIQGWSGENDQPTNVDGVINPANGAQRGFISHAVVLQADGEFTHYLNGAAIASGNHTFATSLQQLLVGQNLNGGETPMKVAAAFVYDRALTQNELDAVEAYIQDTYLTQSVDTPPNAVADTYFATIGVTLTVPASTGLLANDTDNGPLTLIEINGTPVADGATLALANGSLTIEDDGAFSYVSTPGFAGAENFSYTVSDGGQSDSAAVTLDFRPPGGVPVIAGLVAHLESDFNVIETDGVVTEWLSGAGTNMDLVASGDPELVAGATPNGQPAIRFDGGLAAFGEVGAAEGDKLQRAAPQALDDLPTGNAPRSMYFVVDYRASNEAFAGVTFGTGAINAAFGLVLNGIPGEPTVQGWGNDFPAAGYNGIGDNDGSVGDDWFVHSVRYDGSMLRHYRDGELIGTANFAFGTLAEKFVIGEEISGAGFGALDVAAVLVYDKALSDTEHAQTVDFLTRKYFLANTPPVAADDPGAGNEAAFTTDQNTALTTGNVLANDSDADIGDGLSVSAVDTTGTLGVVVNNVNGTFDYNPNGAFVYLKEGESATDTFVYTVSDGRGGSDTASVTITVEGAISEVLVDLPLDEVSGTIAVDVSGKNNDGTLLNGATFVTDTPNGSASALSLDGVNDVVDLGPLAVNGSGLTLATWFKADTFAGPTTNEPRFISKATSTSAPDHVFMLGTAPSGTANRLRARLRINGTTTTLLAGAGDLVAGVWQHAAMTHDGSTLRLYLDGVQVASTSLSGSVDPAPTVPVAIGGQPAGAGLRYFQGMMDDVFIAQRALSAAEVAALPAELTLVTTSPTTSYYAVGELIDYSYLVTNTGAVTLPGPVTIADDRTGTSAVCDLSTAGNGDDSLDIGEAVECSASYAVTQADIDAGSVTNVSNARAGITVSNNDGVTVDYLQLLTLVTTSTTASYDTAGALIEYNYLVTNTGDVTLAGPVTIADDTTTATCPDLTSIGNLDANLDVGEAVTCTASYAVSQADIDAGSVTNVASAAVGGKFSNADGQTISAVQAPGLTLAISSSTASYDTAGDVIDYSYLVSNSGNLTLAGPVIVTDDTETVTCADLATVGNLDINLDVGEAVSCTASYVVTQADLDAGSVTNLASATADGTISNDDGVTVNAAGLTLFVSSATASYDAVGALIEYNYQVSNSGNVTLPGPVTITDDRTATSAVCDLSEVGNGDANLDVDEAVTCSASYAVSAADIDAGSVTNLASASADGTTSNSDGVTIDFVPALTLVASSTTSSYDAVGELIDYVYSVTNTGAETLAGPVTITDDRTGTSGVCDLSTAGNGDASLDVGETVDCTASHAVTQDDIDAGSVTNLASASADGKISNSDGVTVNFVQTLTLVTSSPTTSFNALGAIIDYRYTVTNSGTEPLAGPVTINDDHTGTSASCDLSTVGNLDANLDVGESVLCTASYTVTQDDLDAGSVTNVASASADGKVSNDSGVTVNAVQPVVGALAQLPFEEGSGTDTEDFSGMGNDGTLRSGAGFSPDTPNGSDYALSLDGVGGAVDLGMLDVDGNGLTLAAWFKADVFPGTSRDPRLISKATGTGANDHVFMLSTIALGNATRLRARVRVGGTTTTLIATSGNLATGVWTHAALTHDGATLRLYLNGTPVGNTALAGAVDQAPTVPVAAGGQPPGAGPRYFDGLLDDVLIAQRALSPEEIGVLFTGAPAPELTLVTTSTTASYGSGGDAIDYSYAVTNSGNVSLAGPVTITDSRTGGSAICAALTTLGNLDANLDVGEAVTCTASYAVTQADIDAGSVTNVASASAGGATSNNDGVTVNLARLTLVISTATTSFDAPGDLIDYSYSVSNTGGVILTGPVIVADDRTGTNAVCDLSAVGNGDANLDAGESVICSASYAVSQADIDAGSVTNLANASAGGTTSNSDGVTVNGTGLTLLVSTTTTGYDAVGASIEYSYLVTNTGNLMLVGPVSIADDTAAVNCPAVSTVGNEDGNLDVGESLTCSASYAVSQADIDAGSVTNLASASADGTSSNPDGVTVDAVQTPGLALSTSSTTAGYAAVGDLIDYDYAVTNSGNVTLAGPVTITDDRAGTGAVCDLSAVGNGDANLDVGEQVDCSASYAVTQADIDAGSVTNAASGSAGGATSNVSGVAISAVQSPALTLITSSTTASYEAVGDLVDYVYAVTNSGNVALAGPVSITDDRTGTSAVCDLSTVGDGDADLDAGETVNCGASYAVNQADIDFGSVSNVAEAGAGGTTSNSAGTTVDAVQTPALSLLKSSLTANYDAVGDAIVYEYLVSNSGNLTLTGSVSVDDDKATVSCPAVSSVGNNDGNLDVGESLTCSASYLVVQADIEAGSVTNTATASVGGTLSNPSSVTVFPTATPVLTLAKSSLTADYDAAGDLIAYEYLVTNAGNVPLAGPVSVADDKAAIVTCPAVSTVGNADGNLDVGEAVTCTANYAVTQADIDFGSVTNLATASADGTDSTQQSATVNAVQTPALTLAKSSPTPGYTAVGNFIAYNYLVTNSGNLTLAGPVTIADNKTTATCPALTTIGDLDGDLDVGEAVTCTASYAVEAADIDAGFVTNTATASAADTTSNVASATVNRRLAVAGAVVELPFNEGSGTVANDVSGNNLNGTLLNGATFNSATPDGSTSALELDGVNDVVNLGNVVVNGTGLTVAAWFKADTFPAPYRDPRLISKATGTSESAHVFMLSTIAVGNATRLRARVKIGATTKTLIANSGNVTVGVWRHAALTHDGTTLRLYLNGVQVGSTPLSGQVAQAPSVATAVGGQPAGAGGKYFDGLIDHALIAERALSVAEIETLAGVN